MADGYALLEINTKGEGRIKADEGITFFDLRLECADFDSDYIKEELMGGLPEGINDVLVLATFTYVSEESFNGESTEYEDTFILGSHITLKNNYKEFYRDMVTEELKLEKDMLECIDDPEDKYFEELVGNWEEFYDEDFEPTKPKRMDIEWLFNEASKI